MKRADRREFLLAALGGVAAASLAPRGAGAAGGGGPFTRLGYAAITWAGHDDQAIDDIAAVGFHGIQLRSPIVDRYGDTPAELKRRLEAKGLALMCLSSGTLDADPARRTEYLDTHVKNARFVKAVGGSLTSRERVPSDSTTGMTNASLS